MNAIASLKKEIPDKELPIWVKGLNNHLDAESDPILKVWTHGTVMTILGNPTQSHMEAVGKFLSNKDPLVRIQALTVIGMFEDKGKKYILKDVLPLLDDKDQPAVSAAAYITLARLHHWEPILEKMKDKDKTVRLQVLELISNAGASAKTYVIKTVTDGVEDKDIDVADTAIATLVNIHAFEAIPLLERIIADKMTPAVMRETATEA